MVSGARGRRGWGASVAVVVTAMVWEFFNMVHGVGVPVVVPGFLMKIE